MRVQKISIVNNITQQKNITTNNMSLNFKGKVNGKEYEDWIIKEAKEALDNPKWRNEFLKQKQTVSEAISNWHETLDTEAPKTTRVLMGIFSLGVTEVGYGLLNIAETRQENKQIDKKIEHIEDCMIDLQKEKSKNKNKDK